MARRLHSHLHRLFRWSVGRGILGTNPVADLPKPGSAVKRDRVLTDAELATIWQAAEQTAWPFGPAVQLLVLSAARRDEVGSLRWAEVHGDEIRIPAERSKSGEPRIIPLSPAAMKLISGLPRVGDHVFSANGAGLGGWSKAKRAIDAAAAKLNGGPLVAWRLHDLRRTVATGLQRLGVGLQAIESVLGHISGSRAGVVGVYQRHHFAVEKRAALDAWARDVERIVAGKKKVTPVAKSLTVGSPVLEPAILTPVDRDWLKAIKQADGAISPEPLVAYLRQPGAQLGPGECWWLIQLLERVNFRRRKGGRYVPLTQKSRKEILEICAEYVRDLMRTEELPSETAITKVMGIHPHWFRGDKDLSLHNFMKRGAVR